MKRMLATTTILIALGIPAQGNIDADLFVRIVVVQIKTADYAGDRAELKRLYDELAPFVESESIGSRVRYWRGFALWRRAMNGFNDATDAEELEQDLEQAASEFKIAATTDPGFVDAKIGEGSCLSNLIYLNRGNPTRLRELVLQARQVLNEAEAQAPENPRLAWVRGPNVWYASPGNEENQNKAIAIYEEGLKTIRHQERDSSDLLQPSWGEPELLMNLAWSNLHRKTPNLTAAQTYVQSALSLVPCWHYVRNILMPQIENAIDIAAIQQLRERDIEASKAGDFKTLESLFTDDSVVMPPGTDFIRGRAERDRTMAEIRDTMSPYEVLEYREDFEELRIYGDDAVEWGTISGKVREKRTGKVSVSAYKVMRILRKQPGGDWKISRSMYNDKPLL